VRSAGGRQLAVINLAGKVRGVQGRSVNLAGAVRGSVSVDVGTGKVLQGQAYIDAKLDVRFRDESVSSSGTIEVKVTRQLN
jgi:hypothetical protein